MGPDVESALLAWLAAYEELRSFHAASAGASGDYAEWPSEIKAAWETRVNAEWSTRDVLVDAARALRSMRGGEKAAE